MLRQIKYKSVMPILVKLPKDIKHKLEHPKELKLTSDFFGDTNLKILCSAIREISYCEDEQKDGNWEEFLSWTGLTEDHMKSIKDLMIEHNWKPNDTSF